MSMSLIARVLAVCMLASGVASADAVTDMHLRQLNQLERDLLGLARAVPVDRYDFRPTNGAFSDVRTFGEQVKHAATMIFMTAAIVLDEKSPYGPGTNDNGPDSVRGKDQIVAYLEASLAYAREGDDVADARSRSAL